MYVLMDLEWYEQKKKPLMLTQIAALTVDENWAPEDLFYSRIRPKYQDVSDWTHMAFSGGSQSDFLNASPLRSVLLDLKSWLREDDILCWWSKGGKDRLDSYLKHYGIALPTEQHRFLQGHITLLAEQRGLSAANPYHMAKALGLSTTAKQHYSPDDVAMVQRLLQHLSFPQAKLLLPTKAKKTKTSSKSHPDMLYQMDIEHNLLHRRDCPHISPGALLTEHETINACITGTATACPHCLGAELRQARIDRNKRIIKGSNYVFVYTPGSSVFHQANCPHILDATVINGFGSFDKGVKAGLRPCKHCQPSVNDQVSKVRLGAPQPLPPKKELQAIVRFNKAKMERKEAELEAMTDQEREDFLALTNPGYGFWAAAGYGTFHSRSCRKMKGLTKIRGFAKYDEAIRAGFTPCKCCKPTKKQDIVYSIPMSNRARANETPADLAALCEKAGYEYRRDEDCFEFLTPVGRWRIHLKSMPVTVDHLNLTMTPDNPYLFHRQHRIFLSLRDAFLYIKRHDDDLWHHGRRAISG